MDRILTKNGAGADVVFDPARSTLLGGPSNGESLWCGGASTTALYIVTEPANGAVKRTARSVSVTLAVAWLLANNLPIPPDSGLRNYINNDASLWA